MRKKIRVILILAFILVVLLSAWLYIRQKETRQNKTIKVSGNIETTEVRLSFRTSGKIMELLTDEGRIVKKGEVVARLDTDELLRIKNEAEASLKAAEYNYKQARDDYRRAEELYQKKVIPIQQRDTAKTKADSEKANVEALRASLELAKTRLGFADLLSPLNGFVLTKVAEAGEYTQPGSPVFTVADLTDIWLTAYINETDLGRVKLDQTVDIRTDTYPNKSYKGWVSFISEEAEFTPKHIQTTEERIKLVYRIKVRVNNPNMELKPGMPADGYIIEEK